MNQLAADQNVPEQKTTPGDATASAVSRAADDPYEASPGKLLAEVQRLYDEGQYREALAASKPLGDLKSWRSREGRVLAGRLAANLGAPRIGRTVHWLAGREFPRHPQVQYYAAMAYWSRFGTVHAWRRYRNVQLDESADPVARADWLAMKALMLGALRDFSRAEPRMIQALELDSDSAWLHVELSELLDRQDLHHDALHAAREALKLRPNFRPAVQATAHRLVQLRRDDEALQLLSEAAPRLQSGEVWCQLAALQGELKNYDDAWYSLTRAEECWPLAASDSQHLKWLAGERCDVAYYRGQYEEAIKLAEGLDRPFYQRLTEKLKKALQSPPPVDRAPRVQLPVPFVRQFHDTCAPATLTSIAHYWQKPVRHEEIVERICYEGTRAYDERRWAEENGFHAREFRVTEEIVEALIRAGIPMSLNTVDPGSAHLQGIVGIDIYRGTFLVQDPSERHVGEAAADKFLEHYASTGPRGMIMLPHEEASRVAHVALPDAEMYDDYYVADRALARHDRQAATDAVERLMQRAPEHRLTLQARLSLARYDSSPTDQMSLVERLLAQFPNDANLLLMKCSLLNEFGQRSQRIDLLRSVCQGEKAHPIFWSRLAAELLDDARDHDEAYYQLRRALRFNQGDGRTLSLLADYFWNKRDRAAALEYYRLAASLSEKDESQARRYFLAARYLHETPAALEWLRDRYVRFGKQNSSPGRTLASALEQIDRTPESLQIIEETVGQHPGDGELLSFAALYFGRYNQPERAAECLKAAEGKCSRAVFVRASAQLANYQGDLTRARELFLEAVRLDPLDMDARERVLQVDMDLEGNDVAEQRLRAAVAEFPHSYSLRVMLIQWLRSFKLAAASDELERFLQFHPRDAWGRREAAITSLTAHDLTRASREVELAIELEPHNEIAHFLQGKVFEQQGNVAAARAAYRHAIERNVDYDSAISSLVDTCDRPAERAEQLDFILEQLREQTTHGEAILCYREVADYRMEPSRLLEQLEEARSHRPDLWQTWSVVAQQHSSMNQRQKAVEVAAEATERFPLLPRSWLDLALAHRKAGDHDAELAALERARAINPLWSEVARELSELYMNREQFDEAEKVIRQVLASDPRDPASLAWLGECLYRAGKKNESLGPMVSACASSPGYDWAWARLCEWSHELDQGHSARTAAEQAISSRPHDARCYRRMAEALSELDEIPQALVQIEKSLELDDRSLDAHVLKAYYLGKMHQWDEALEACNPPVFAGDVPVLLRMRRAYILYRKGLTAEAIEELRGALERDPDHYGGWNQLADWADETGGRDVYKQAAENMVRLDPHQPAPRGYLADALMVEEGGRPEAKVQLRTALEFSPDYVFGAMRLFDLHIEDNELEAAGEVLQIGGTHLPPGYEKALHTHLLAAQDAKREPLGRSAVDYLLQWTAEESFERAPLLRAVDHFAEPVAQLAISELTRVSTVTPNQAGQGVALGRLLGRVGSTGQCLAVLKSLPDGELWHETVQTLLRSMAGFRKEFALVPRLRVKYKKRLRAKTNSWAAVSATLLDYGQNSDVVKWTRDWQQRTDATPLQLVAVVASRWECFQFKAARRATEHALTLTADDGTPLFHVWAGIDAVLRGENIVALEHARQVSIHQLSQWYIVGYRILVCALESLPGTLGDKPPQTKAQSRQMVDALCPSKFPLEPPFVIDQLTKWLLRRVAARVAYSHGLVFRGAFNRFVAFGYTHR